MKDILNFVFGIIFCLIGVALLLPTFIEMYDLSWQHYLIGEGIATYKNEDGETKFILLK